MQQANHSVTISSEVTIYSVMQLKEQLLSLLDQYEQIELDLSQVNEIDGAGIQLLISAKLEAEHQQKKLQLSNHTQCITDALELLELSAWFGDPQLLTA